jgi:hypothetical protein
VIKRNGIKVAKTTTDGAGYYEVRLKDRRGRYLARSPKLETAELPSSVCTRARSPLAYN